jgi:arylsulfatase A-like enzyme
MWRVRRSARRCGVAALALLLLVACQPPRLGQHDIVLVSIDTLRADRLGAYGYERPTSPSLDALAARGVVFENVIAESPWTLPSHLTMFTGLHPTTHGVNFPDQRPDDATALLAEILREDGYRTFGFTGGGYLRAEHGFDRGFEVFDSAEAPFREKATAALAAIQELDEGERFFLFLHTFDVHCPYEPAAPYAGTFVSPDAEPIDTHKRCGNAYYNVQEGLTDGQIRHVSDRYDDGILEADATLGWLLAQLGEERLRNTIFVVTSDHGEEFREHGRVGHEATLHREVLAIPWVVAGPGVTPGRLPGLVGLSDVTPTLLELAGLPVPEGLDGRSRVAWLAGAAAGVAAEGEPRVSVNHWKRSLHSVMTPEWHLITDVDAGESALFAAGDDRLEQHDVAEVHASELDFLRGLLEAHMSGAATLEPSTIDELTSEQRDQLRALGYIE